MKKYFILLLLICLFVTGCGTKTEVKLDKKNKLSDDEIVEYIRNYMYENYDKNFTIELVTKNDLTYNEGFSVMGVPTGTNSYKVEGGYDYEFKIIDENNVIAKVKYTDAYYVNQTYHDVTFEENYGNIISTKKESMKLEEIAYQYLKNDEIIKYEYIDKTFTSSEKSVIYLNYYTNNITKELIGKLIGISIDYNMRNAYVIFLDQPNNFYQISYWSGSDIQKIYNIAFKGNEFDGKIDSSKQDLYDSLYTSFKNETTLSDTNIKSIEDQFFKCIQNFINIFDNFYDLKINYDSQNQNGVIHIYLNTLNNNQIQITARFYYNAELEKYEYEYIQCWNDGPIQEHYLKLYYK